MTIIYLTSQRYRNETIVDAKHQAGDYVVSVTPPFEYDDCTFCLVVDGHHSHSAAIENGIDPIYVEAPGNALPDWWGLDVEDMLQAAHLGGDYHDINTGKNIW